jgi:hypothetical protein
MITPSDAPEPWIVGVIIGGAVLALLLVGVAIGFIIKRRARAQEAPDDNANYAAIDVAAPRDYDQGRLDSNDDDDDDPTTPAQSNYAVIPGPAESARDRNYDNGRIGVDTDYAVGRLT